MRSVVDMVWAGAVRIGLLHHVTWNVNSLRHMFYKHPYLSAKPDRQHRMVRVISSRDSWHNSHHAFPAFVRHGSDRGQLDPPAAVLGVLEGLRWATQVRWPNPATVARRAVD